jgi:hypothetical protein
LAGRFPAVQKRHSEVHDYDVGPELGGQVNGFAASLGFSDDGDVSFSCEERFEALAYDIVVVGKQYIDVRHNRSMA